MTKNKRYLRQSLGLRGAASVLVLSLMPATAAYAEDDVAKKAPVAFEEITVTAQKREQRYIDVAGSFSLLSSDLLESTQTSSYAELAQISPSINFTPSGDPRGSGVLIRGIGTTSFHLGVEPTVSTVLDGVAIGRTGAFLMDLVDVERVEVLRGPQSTLFGKNASAGVINIVTKRPTEELEGMVHAYGTTDSEYALRGSVSGPLTEKVRARLTGYYKYFDGTVEHAATGKTLNGNETFGVRGKVEFDLGENTMATIIADYMDQTQDGIAYTLRSAVSPFFITQLDAAGVVPGPKNNKFAGKIPSVDQTNGGVSLEVVHDFGAVTLTSITGYRDWELRDSQASSPITVAGPTPGFLYISGAQGTTLQDQLSQEIRINNSQPGVVDYTLGAFYWEQDLFRDFGRTIELCLDMFMMLPTCNMPLVDSAAFQSNANTTNYSFFGQGEWHITDQLTAILGGRYTHDKIDWDITRPPTTVVPNFSPGIDAEGSNSSDGWAGKAGLQYAINDNAQTYFTYSRGYKAEAIALIFGASEDSLDPIPAEKSDAFELGYKATIADGRAIVSAALFYTKFKNYQAQVVDLETFDTVLTNAGSVRTQGFELDLLARPTDTLNINFGMAYTDAKILDFAETACYNGQTVADGCVGGLQDISGGDIPMSPDWKFHVQARKDFLLNSGNAVYTIANYRWQSESLGFINQAPISKIPSYGILDLTLGFETSDGRLDVSVVAKNVLDKQYPGQVLESFFDRGMDGSSGALMAIPRDFERYFGLNARYNF